MESKPVRLGGLWLNTSKSGVKYMSGSFGFAQILVFKNDKKKDTDPDYTICIAEKPQKENGQKQVAEDDDVPF